MLYILCRYSVSTKYFSAAAAAAAKSPQSCPTLCDPTDSSPPGSAVPGVLQARTLEWAAIVFRSILINDFRLRRAHSNRTKENFES